LKVSYTVDDISDKKQIAPMLLIPFVENAFKHGSLINGFLKVDIQIILIENQLRFSIKNTVLKDDLKESKVGIGLENIKKRLNLLYKNNYQLLVENQDGWYQVQLIISNLNRINNV